MGVFLDETGLARLWSKVKGYCNSLTSEFAETIENLPKGNVAYGTCSAVATTAIKDVTVTSDDNWTLEVGCVVMVYFTTSNSASSVKLNVNNTGAYPIWYNNAEYTSTGTAYTGYAKRVIYYMFNGTHWVWLGASYDANTTYTNVALGQGYATCSTAASTTAKVGTLSSYALTTGGIVSVKFTNAVPASATLNINSKGAKAMYFRGAAITAGIIKAGDVATFIYNGSQYHLLSIDRWQNDITSLSSNKVDKSGISLGIASDGLMYVYVDGSPVGTGLSQGQSADVYGDVDTNNNIVLSGELADGTYTLKYENADGTTTEIGSFTVGEVLPSYTNLFNPATASINTRYSNSSGTLNTSATGYVLTDYIPVTIPAGSAKKLRIRGASLKSANSTVLHFISSKQFNSLTNAGTMGVGIGTANGWGNVYTDDNGDEYIKLGYYNATQNKADTETFDNNLTDTVYIRVQFQLKTTSVATSDIQDIIITIDEPITD